MKPSPLILLVLLHGSAAIKLLPVHEAALRRQAEKQEARRGSIAVIGEAADEKATLPTALLAAWFKQLRAADAFKAWLLPTTLLGGLALLAQLQAVQHALKGAWGAFVALLVRLWSLLFGGAQLVGLSTAATNDRLDGNVWQWLAAEPQKAVMISTTLAAPALSSPALRKKAEASHLPITPHLAYRYLAAADWADTYNGKPMAEAIAATVAWREAFGIARLDPRAFAHLIKSGLGYVGPQLDKRGRAIIYMKVGRVGDKLESNAVYESVLMYTVERAERLAVHKGRGEFITIVDLANYNFGGKSGMPFSTITGLMNLLKLHYPYRLGGVFVVNGSPSFNLFWRLIKPLVPRKTLAKTFVLGRHDMAQVLDEKLGLSHVEEAYGGAVKEGAGVVDDVDKYIREGYWYGKKR
jgi:CRAL/TRIO domain